MNIAIIPARGGSKRIPRKNIKLFAGRPVISYAISAAKKTGLFSRIIVSSDDEEIIQIAKKYGAEAPFIRPHNLSDDMTSTSPVINHAIDFCLSKSDNIENVCCIYPCVPLISSKDIQKSLDMMLENKSDSCFPVSEFISAPQRALTRNNNGRMQSLHPEFKNMRTQDLEPSFFDVGQFYWGKISAWKDNAISEGLGLIIPKWRVVDIDSLEDWKMAELYYELLHNKGV